MKYLFLILTLPLWAQTQSQKKLPAIPNPQKLEDFDHQNKGCPENSECDPVMGQMLSRWKKLLEKLAPAPGKKPNAPEMIELFRQKYGIPVEFYTYQASQLGFKPLLFSSPCKEHNPKESANKTLRGIAFMKSMTKEVATAVRAEAVIEVPTKESLVVSQPVKIMDGPNPTTYYLPIGDQPLYIKDKSLIVLREDEDIFYTLKVSLNGDWKVVPTDLTTLSTWEDRREPVECPELTVEKKSPHPKEFNLQFCKTVWDEDLKKTVIVKMHQGCSI